MKQLIFLLTIFAATVCSGAEEGFFGAHEEGWFWYKDPPQIKIEPEKPKKKTDAPEAKTTKSKGKETLTVEWIRENLPKTLDAAIQNPNDEKSVRQFSFLMRAVSDMSNSFASKIATYSRTTPALDIQRSVPYSQPAKRQVDSAIENAKTKALKQIAKTTGLAVFINDKCKFCELQMDALQAVKTRSGIRMDAVSSFGQEAKKYSFFDRVRVDAAGKKFSEFNLKTYPSIVLVSENAVTVVSEGVSQETDLIDRIILAGQKQNLVDEGTKISLNQYMIGELSGDEIQNIGVENFDAELEKLLNEKYSSEHEKMQVDEEL